MKSATTLLDAKKIAERLSISVRLAQRLMEEMKPVNVGAGEIKKLWRVRESELERWIDERTREPEIAAPVLKLVKPKKKWKAAGAYPQPVDGKIPNRR